jgi:calcineurin-like phosphoesterase family protein
MTTATDKPVLIPAPRWVISDTHLGHANILEYCPWRQTWATSVEEHDRAIITAWQAAVAADDWVLHLGDFALGEKSRLPELRRKLPGRIILVRGNHDRSLSVMRESGFELVVSAVRIEGERGFWIGRHNPAAFSVREASDAIRLLHGHSHGNRYSPDTPEAIRAKARDCSLDALRAVGPQPWSGIR